MFRLNSIPRPARELVIRELLLQFLVALRQGQRQPDAENGEANGDRAVRNAPARLVRKVSSGHNARASA